MCDRGSVMLRSHAPDLQRRLAWFLAAWLLVIGTGIQPPCSVQAVRTSERFPCEHCRCGCRTAERCWRQCCCYTQAQKVAWAAKQGVPVPEFVLAAVQQEIAAAQKPKCPHCVRRAGAGAVPSATCASPPIGHPSVNDQERIPAGVCWLEALRCRGLTEPWQTAVTYWPGTQSAGLHLILIPLGRVRTSPLLPHLFSPPEPPTPPPRLVAIQHGLWPQAT